MGSTLFMSRKECNKCAVAIAVAKCRISSDNISSICSKRCSKKAMGSPIKKGEKKCLS